MGCVIKCLSENYVEIVLYASLSLNIGLASYITVLVNKVDPQVVFIGLITIRAKQAIKTFK